MSKGEIPTPKSPTTAVSAISWGAENLLGITPDHDLARRESRWLLEAAAVASAKSPLLLNESDLTPRVIAVFRSNIARRARGEPLAYVIGEASFRGYDLYVTPDVLIPRPETELLVDLVLERVGDRRRILDQGTGSGAIAVALALEAPSTRITAVDLSPSACDLARRNVKRHGVEDRVRVMEADLYPLEKVPFDVIVANLPYISDDAVLPEDVAGWEPKHALRGGRKGTEMIEKSIRIAEKYSVPQSLLFYEIGDDQRDIFTEFFSTMSTGRDRAWSFEFKNDLTGRTRFIIGKMNG